MEDLIKRILLLIERDKLDTKCRHQRIVNKRFYLFFILRQQGYTFKHIGEFFNLHHATVLYGINKYKELKKNKDAFLHRDINEYQIILGEIEVEYNLKREILEAKTIKDLNLIQKKIINNKYIELK